MVRGSIPRTGSIFKPHELHIISMKTTTKGKIAEHRFITEFLKKGYRIFVPVEENDPVDLMVYMHEKWNTFQVKYITPNNGTLTIDNRMINGSTVVKLGWYNDKIDYFAIFDSDNDKGYIVPADLVSPRGLTIRIEPPKNKQVKGIHLADKYLFF